ncbi:uncharacterized protein LOC110466877 [Mizuhopecten yessoensis]|uniref:uncharacterized protein LOC110466877 n=1 Tax=Mizuhopecten yessoensis TaxID=6573 RepID=UPI000B4581B2|nr:uncharacterized protein LOC110466877 [Mizuhopecten yessoensis]
MSAMFVKLIVLFYISDCFGLLNGEKLDLGKLPRQWQDLETFVHQKFQDVDRLLIEKDERVDQLQSILTNQKVEITQLKQGMATLEQEILHKDGIVNRLVNRITELETIVMLDTIPQEPESRQDIRQSTSFMNDGLVRFQSPITDTTSLRQSIGSPPSANRTGESPLRQDFTSDSEFRDEILADPPASQQILVKSENEAEDVSRTSFPRLQQKRVAPSSQTPRQTIAFHVSLSTDKEYHEDSTVVYDNEKLDHGDGYSPGDGIYIVPNSGTYVFTWTSICDVHQQFQTVIVVNGAYMGSSWTDAENVNDGHQTTTVVVLTLNQGDHVYIRMGSTIGHGNLLSRTNLGESTFSGWKLD